MYNKRRFTKFNDKKILHKIKKHWVVLSVALLGVLGTSHAMTTSVHADSTPTSLNHAGTLQDLKPSHTRVIPAASNTLSYSDSSSSRLNLNDLQQRASALHDRILKGGFNQLTDDHKTPTDHDSVRSDNNSTDPCIHHVIVNGTWGTVPYRFDETTGALSTTGSGQISPVHSLNGRTSDQMSNLSSVKNRDLRRIRSIDIANPVTAVKGNAKSLFADLPGLRSINLNGFDSSNVHNMVDMFDGDLSLTSLDLSRFNTNGVDTYHMFNDTPGLQTIKLGDRTRLFSTDLTSKWYLENAQGYTSLNPIDLDDGLVHPGIYRSTPNVSANNYIYGVWGTAPYQFDPNNGLLRTTGPGTISPIGQLSGVPLSAIHNVNFAPGTKAPKDSELLFGMQGYDEVPTTDGPSDSIAYVSKLRNLSDVDCTNLDTSDVTNMTAMFYYDSDLDNVTFGPDFNTSQVQSTAQMFQSDLKLKSLNLSRFDTQNVLDMTAMFKNDTSLTELNLGPHFNTNYVGYLSDMFHNDYSLRSLDLGNQFYVDPMYNNRSLSAMFANDYNLRSLNLGPHFDTSSTVNLSDMFINDSDLNSLNLGPLFDTSRASDMHDMFKNDTELSSIDLGRRFDTTLASRNSRSKTSDGNAYSGVSDVIHYKGAQGIFSNDKSLVNIKANDIKLTGATDLPKIPQTVWYSLGSDGQPQGGPVNLNDGQLHTGAFKSLTNVPKIQTVLNFRDVNRNDQSIGEILVTGSKHNLIPFAVVSNALGDGYISAIPIRDLMMNFPNTPYRYQTGVINVPVKQIKNSVGDGNRAPVITKDDQGRSERQLVNSYLDQTPQHRAAIKAAQAADQRIAEYYRDSVANSVASANRQRASAAAQSADQRIDGSIAASAAESADHKLAQSYRASVADSVSAANQQLSASYQSSFTASVSMANQQRANAAAQSADQRIADSAAEKADDQIRKFDQSSISASVSAANQRQASLAAQSADQWINNSIAASAAESADQRLVQSYRASVADSVSAANQKLSTSYQSSVEASVSIANQQRASAAAQSADQEINSSLIVSAAESINKKIRTSYQASISASVSIVNQRHANFVACSTDQKSENSLSASARSANVVPIDHFMSGSNVADSLASSSLNSNSSKSSSTASIQSLSNSGFVASANPNQLRIGQRTVYRHVTVARKPVRINRWLNIHRRCRLYNRINGKPLNAALKSGQLIRIEKVFKVRRGHLTLNYDQLRVGNRDYFIINNHRVASPAYWQSRDLRRHRGRRYCRAVIRKVCGVYKSPRYRVSDRIRRKHPGAVVKIKRIISIGRRGDYQTCFELTNGRFITANRRFIKLL